MALNYSGIPLLCLLFLIFLILVTPTQKNNKHGPVKVARSMVETPFGIPLSGDGTWDIRKRHYDNAYQQTPLSLPLSIARRLYD